MRQQDAINSVLDMAADHATLDAALKAVTNDTLAFVWVLDERGQHLSYNPRNIDAMEARGMMVLGMFTARASVCHLASDIINDHETEGRSARDIIVDTLLRSSRKIANPDSANKDEQAFAVVIKAGDSQGNAAQNIVTITLQTFGSISEKMACMRAAPAGAVTLAIECLRVFDEQDAHRHDIHGLGGLAHLLGGEMHSGGIIVNLGDLIREAREENLMPPEGGEEGSVRFTGLFGRGRRNRGERS